MLFTARDTTRHAAVMQLVPAMHVGGVERGVLEVDAALEASGASSFVASAGGPLASKLAGCHLCFGSLARRDPLCVLLVNPFLLALWMRRHDVRLLHARSRCLVASALLACAITPGAQLVATWHGLYSAGNPLRRAFNGLLLRATRLILPSAFIRTHLRREYPRADATCWRLVHRGVAAVAGTDELPPCEAVPRRAVVLLPGRLSRSKGQAPFVTAITRLPHTLLTGDGERVLPVGRLLGAKPPSNVPRRIRSAYEQSIFEAVDSARRRGAHLTLEPHTSAMQGAYEAAAVVAMPSVRPEAFGRVLLEALAARRLVVAFNHGAVGEIAAAVWEAGGARRVATDRGAAGEWCDAKCGQVALVSPGVLLMGAVYLVAPGDVDGLAHAIEAALVLPVAERRWRTECAARAACARFGLRTFTEATLAVYEEVHSRSATA